MKIKSVEELEDKLQEDLAWRKKEILSFKMLIESDEINKKILLRASVALLCAHFEGFVKKASNYYIVYIASKKIKAEKIKNTLVAIKLKHKIEDCGKTNKHSVHGEMITILENIKEKNFFIKYTDDNPIISTESNPSSKVLKEILKTIGIESDVFDLKARYIDNNLLKNRHYVVHGERYDLRGSEFMETCSIVLTLLESYKEVIINAAERELFLKEKINSENTEGL